MRPARSVGPRWLPGAVSFLAPLGLYTVTACRDIYWLDTTELMLAGRFLVVPHPPGYPLLMLLVRLASLLPLSTLPHRLNLVSAVAAAASCLALFASVRKLTGSRIAGLFSALCWSLCFELWSQATVLEVYTINTLFAATLLWLATMWTTEEDTRYFLAACFVFGLGMTNHLSLILWIPALLGIAGVRVLRALRVRGVLSGAALGLLGLCLYLYVPLRSGISADTSWSGASTLAGFADFVSGRAYRYRVLAGGASYVVGQIRNLPWLLAKQFLLCWVIVIPGAVWMWRKRRAALAGLAAAAVAVVAAALAYNIPDKEGYLLPAYLAFAVLAGAGLALLRETRARIWTTAVALLLLVPSLVLLYPILNRSRLRGLSDLTRAVLAELPPGSVAFTDDFSIAQGTTWLQRSGIRTDAPIINEHLLVFPWYLEVLDARHPGLRVPPEVKSQADRVWRNAGSAAGVGLGEYLRDRTQDIKLSLVQRWLRSARLFWVPLDFQSPPDQWRGHPLRLHGLAYEILPPDDTTAGDTVVLLFPGPDKYRTRLFRDKESEDVCRRFAATANRRGIGRYAGGDASGALSDFSLALQYYPDYAGAIENKGIVFYFERQYDSSRHYLRRYLELEPSSPEAPKVRQMLMRLAS